MSKSRPFLSLSLSLLCSLTRVLTLFRQVRKSRRRGKQIRTRDLSALYGKDYAPLPFLQWFTRISKQNQEFCTRKADPRKDTRERGENIQELRNALAKTLSKAREESLLPREEYRYKRDAETAVHIRKESVVSLYTQFIESSD